MFFVPIYILILGFTIVIDYFAGIAIENAEGKKRRFYLIISLVANLGVLAVFKYYNFFIENINESAHAFGINGSLPLLTILLPVGLSFHTFQAMSYTIEVYRGNQAAERHFGIYSLYVMFYPQLVAGPIERPQNLLQQFREKHNFDYDQAVSGLKLIIWGMFKKIVIADRLAAYVDPVYNQPQAWDGLTLIVATVFFAFEIYCDFSGYSDIAIGAARVMGFKLMTNFNRPYHAKSIAEFWKRWHISLSTWFKDYLYISLGGNRGTKSRWYFNLFFVFLVSGLWHGANWTFIIWGALNGFYLLFSIWTARYRKFFVQAVGFDSFPNLHRAFQILLTFTLTCYAWLFFRANNLTDAIYINKAIISTLIQLFNFVPQPGPLSLREWAFCVIVIAFLEIVHFTQTKKSLGTALVGKPIWLRWSVYYALILTMLLFGQFGHRQFIYFQF
jgi:D-alanyl-lipoteichoic acid acyltransferase DltB (MBOAT superfamily)